jgi:hypothetical protein
MWLSGFVDHAQREKVKSMLDILGTSLSIKKGVSMGDVAFDVAAF